jgi:hypothetical protein
MLRLQYGLRTSCIDSRPVRVSTRRRAHTVLQSPLDLSPLCPRWPPRNRSCPTGHSNTTPFYECTCAFAGHLRCIESANIIELNRSASFLLAFSGPNRISHVSVIPGLCIYMPPSFPCLSLSSRTRLGVCTLAAHSPTVRHATHAVRHARTLSLVPPTAST